MNTTIRNLVKQVASLTTKLAESEVRNMGLTIENNALRNLYKAPKEARDTDAARELLGGRRWDDQIESENSVQPSKTPLYLSSVERVDMSNPARLRKHQAKQSQQ